LRCQASTGATAGGLKLVSHADGNQKQFAAFLAFTCSFVGSVMQGGSSDGVGIVAQGAIAMLCVCAALEAFLGFCMGTCVHVCACVCVWMCVCVCVLLGPRAVLTVTLIVCAMFASACFMWNTAAPLLR
jgi:hypothetical protein